LLKLKHMSKDTYFFSHDSFARRDPKIMAMMSIYSSAGYGYYWILVEMMREQDGYKLNIDGKYSYKVIGTELDIADKDAEEFVDDCVNEFGLFRIEDGHLISDSLLSRMKHLDDKREMGRKSAKKRWDKHNKKKKPEKEVDSGLPFEDEDAPKKPTDTEVFLKVFNSVKKESIKGSKGHDSLSDTSKRNLKKLLKRGYFMDEFEKAAIAMFQNKWVHDTGNTGPAHLLVEDNFDRYYCQAVEQNIKPTIVNDNVQSYEDIMNG